MQHGWMIAAFVLASGFTAAGLLSSMHRLVWPDEENDPGRLVLHFHTPAAVAWSLIICAFTGPWLLITKGIHFWRLEIMPAAGLALCMALAFIWSFFSGIVVVESLRFLGHLLA